jgi:hypothetical protein
MPQKISISFTALKGSAIEYIFFYNIACSNGDFTDWLFSDRERHRLRI